MWYTYSILTLFVPIKCSRVTVSSGIQLSVFASHYELCTQKEGTLQWSCVTTNLLPMLWHVTTSQCMFHWSVYYCIICPLLCNIVNTTLTSLICEVVYISMSAVWYVFSVLLNKHTFETSAEWECVWCIPVIWGINVSTLLTLTFGTHVWECAQVLRYISRVCVCVSLHFLLLLLSNTPHQCSEITTKTASLQLSWF